MHVRFSLGALFVFSLGLYGCGDDDSGPMVPEDHLIEFPGDAATLQEAINLASEGDTVRVLAGTHVVDAPIVVASTKSGITIEGEHASTFRHGETILDFQLVANLQDGITVRAQNVKIHEIEIRGSLHNGVVFDSSPGFNAAGGTIEECAIRGVLSYAISCTGVFSDTRIERNLIVSPGVFGVACEGGAHPEIERNTIVGAGDCGIYSNGASPTCARNIVAKSENWGIACFNSPLPSLSCNVLWQNATADYSPDCVPGSTDIVGLDPGFCDETAFHLMLDSPCLAGNTNNGSCGNIGAIEETCAGR